MKIDLKVWAFVLLAVSVVIGFTVMIVVQRTACPPAIICPPKKLWQGPHVDRPVKFAVEFYGMTYKGRSDNVIDAHILYFGAWEKSILYFMRDYFKRARIIGKGVFLDVGANTGQHSMYMSKYAAHVHAVEPFNPVLERFKGMIVLNGLQNITIHSVGLGASRELKTFFAPSPNNLGTGSFDGAYRRKNVKDREMLIVSGDELLQHVRRIDLIKIDIEGYERPALRGLKETLKRTAPVVVSEISVDPSRPLAFKSMLDLADVFPHGYEFLTFDGPRCDPRTGVYYLTPQPPRFGKKKSYTLVAYPASAQRFIPGGD